MAHNSRDHGNDAGAFFCCCLIFYFIIFIFYQSRKTEWAIFQETSTKINNKNYQCYCKKQVNNNFIVYTLTDHRNEVKIFTTLQ